MTKYIVVHSGARDQYKLAESLLKHDKLGFLVTDDIIFRKEYKKLFPRSVIRISYMALLLRAMLKVYNFGEPVQRLKGMFLGRKAGKISKRYNMPLCALQEYAYHAFKQSVVHPRIVFQYHPEAHANMQIFNDEIKKHPDMANFRKEIAIYTPTKLQEAADELHMADYFIAASSFTRKTLVDNGASPSRVFVAPYGVDISKYPYKKRTAPARCVKFAFVGSFVERKGVSYLLKAIKQLEQDGYEFEINVTSRSESDTSQIVALGLHSVKMHCNLSHENLIEMLHSSDVFVFPSLFEGFAFVIVEAMATGLPVITTNRTCGPDVITDGEEGFIIEPSDVNAIYEKMKYFILNPDRCPSMGYKAAQRAKSITWLNFENKVIKAVEMIEKEYTLLGSSALSGDWGGVILYLQWGGKGLCSTGFVITECNRTLVNTSRYPTYAEVA